MTDQQKTGWNLQDLKMKDWKMTDWKMTDMLQTKTNFNGYDPLRHVIVLNTNLTTYIFPHLQLYLLKKMNKQKKS